MSKAEELKIATKVSQDVTMAAAILKLMAESKVTFPAISLCLKKMNHVLDGRPIVSDPISRDDKIRSKRFYDYCTLVTTFLLAMHLCFKHTSIIDQEPIGPYEMTILRPTRFGNYFLKMPFWMQCCVFRTLEIGHWLVFNIKKYKWIGTVVSMLIGILGWIKTHELSGYLIVIAATVGAISTFIVAFLFHVLGESNQIAPDDDTFA